MKTWTYNEDFDRDGYVILKNLCDPKELETPLPTTPGMFVYDKLFGSIKYIKDDPQVHGCTARYNLPHFDQFHTSIRLKLEDIIGRKLYNTYYFDRIYYPGHDLKRHTDRGACEISVSVHVGDNIDHEWPLWIVTPQGEARSVVLSPGDGVLYKGIDNEHWRDPLPEPAKGWFKKNKNPYFHQVFFHYVLQDGYYTHHGHESIV